MIVARVAKKLDDDWVFIEEWEPILCDRCRFGITVPKSVKCPDGYTEIDYHENRQDWCGITILEGLFYLPLPLEEKDYKIIIIPGEYEQFKDHEEYDYPEYDSLLKLLGVDLEVRKEEMNQKIKTLKYNRPN
jgi:hypothetical protein